MNPPAVRCSKRIWSSGMGMKYHNCTRAAKVEREGLPYCGIHDPAAAQARADKREAKWAAKRKADEARWFAASTARARAELCVEACFGIPDEVLLKFNQISRERRQEIRGKFL